MAVDTIYNDGDVARALMEESRGSYIIPKVFELYSVNCIDICRLDRKLLDRRIEDFMTVPIKNIPTSAHGTIPLRWNMTES